MDFYEVDKNLKAQKKSKQKDSLEEQQVLLMLALAEYIKFAWDAILDVTIKNAFNKAELVTLKGATHEEVDMMADLLGRLKALNIPVDLDEFVREYSG